MLLSDYKNWKSQIRWHLHPTNFTRELCKCVHTFYLSLIQRDLKSFTSTPPPHPTPKIVWYSNIKTEKFKKRKEEQCELKGRKWQESKREPEVRLKPNDIYATGRPILQALIFQNIDIENGYNFKFHRTYEEKKLMTCLGKAPLLRRLEKLLASSVSERS